MKKENLRIKEAATYLKCSEKHIRSLATEGELIAFRIGKNPKSDLRITSESLEAYVRRQIQLFQKIEEILLK